MIGFRTGTLGRLVAIGLVLVMYVLPGAGGAAALAAAKPLPSPQPTLTLTVLPFDKVAQEGSSSLGADLATAVKSALEPSGKFYAVGFSERLPSVQRAISEASLTKRDTEGPFSTDKALAVKVARAVGADVVVVGSVDQIKIDAANGVAEVAVSAQIIGVESQEVLDTLALTGKNTAKPKEGTGEADLVSLAAGDAAVKIAAAIAADPKLAQVQAKPSLVPPPASKPKKSGRALNYLLLAILLVAGVALVGGGHHHGNNAPHDGDTQAPSVPTSVVAEAVSSSSIMVGWTASTDNVGVTGYKVFRNGSQVGTATNAAYADTGLSASTTYSYIVSAYDAAGNNSARSSPAATATTRPGGGGGG